MLTHDHLREILKYNPQTGAWNWVVSRGSVRRGDIAGSVGSHGYRQISIGRRLYLAHRLAFLWMTGPWPTDQVDHRDLGRANDCWENLREATRSQNYRNRRALVTNKCGLKGAHWKSSIRRWAAAIRDGGRQKHLGYFDCPQDAHAAYVVAAKESFGEFSRSS
jgi:hypothetical protein